ncbi:MAG: NUDIX hydrolase [Chloroflexi bacterium]|nr:NUDIX hydrolase [Chloroflexota bacterium]
MTTETRPPAQYRRYERQVSAGGVVYRLVEGRMEVLLCGRREPLLWSLPKGTPDPGEGIRDTALREVEEETGVKVAILGKLGTIRYFFTRIQDNTRCDKSVHHYLMESTGGDTSRHDHEFDEARWFPLEEALEIMSYPNEAAMVRKAGDAVSGKVRLRRLSRAARREQVLSPEGGSHG